MSEMLNNMHCGPEKFCATLYNVKENKALYCCYIAADNATRMINKIKKHSV